VHHDARRDAFDFTSHSREDFYACLTRRGDTLFELCDAMLCENGTVTSPVDLTPPAEHRRGHGALYDALNQGRVDVDRLRKALAMLPQTKAADGRLVLAVDVSPWLRPDAPTSPDRRIACAVPGPQERQTALHVLQGSHPATRRVPGQVPDPSRARHRGAGHRAPSCGASVRFRRRRCTTSIARVLPSPSPARAR
jgi:hypothetical protein